MDSHWPPEGIDERGDLIGGADGNDFIYGAERNDALFGGKGHDLVVGGGGDDFISSGGDFDGTSNNQQLGDMLCFVDNYSSAAERRLAV